MKYQNKSYGGPNNISEACELRKSNKQLSKSTKGQVSGFLAIFYHGVNFTSSKQIGQNLTES